MPKPTRTPGKGGRPKAIKKWSTTLTHPSYSVEPCPNCSFPEADGGYCPECGWSAPVKTGRVS